MAGRRGTAPTKNGPNTPYPPAKHEKNPATECFSKNVFLRTCCAIVCYT